MTDRHNYGCFVCGEIDPSFEEDEQGFTVCACGKHRTIVSFQQALDLLNEFRILGYEIIHDPEQQEDLF